MMQDVCQRSCAVSQCDRRFQYSRTLCAPWEQIGLTRGCALLLDDAAAGESERTVLVPILRVC